MTDDDRSSGASRKQQPPIVLLDANVLYSRILGDYFVQLHENGVTSVKWSPQILDEVVRNKQEEHLAKYSDPQDLLPRLAAAEGFRAYAEQRYPESYIDPSDDYYARFADLHMPDPDDRHVVAAALAAGATHLCTSNAADFPDPVVQRVGIERIKPDALLHEHAGRNPLAMVKAHQQVMSWTRGTTHRGLLERLRRAQAPAIAEALKRILKSRQSRLAMILPTRTPPPWPNATARRPDCCLRQPGSRVLSNSVRAWRLDSGIGNDLTSSTESVAANS